MDTCLGKTFQDVRKDQRVIVNSLYTVILSFNRVLIGTVKSIDYGRYDDGLAL